MWELSAKLLHNLFFVVVFAVFVVFVVFIVLVVVVLSLSNTPLTFVQVRRRYNKVHYTFPLGYRNMFVDFVKKVRVRQIRVNVNKRISYVFASSI